MKETYQKPLITKHEATSYLKQLAEKMEVPESSAEKMSTRTLLLMLGFSKALPDVPQETDFDSCD